MRLISFRFGQEQHIGIRMDAGILDLNIASNDLPMDMISFLNLGKQGILQAQKMLSSFKNEWILAEDEVELLAPVPNPGKILCIGHNYSGHIGIGKTELPEYPNLFCKTGNTIIADQQAIIIPQASDQADFEAELMVVIGKRAYCVSEKEAEECIAGYTLFNDVSARDYQKRTSQWMLGKCFDTFGPMGPDLVTPDEIPDLYQLELELRVNGVLKQKINTDKMIFSAPFLISYISQVMTLEVGDVIATGTPAKLPEAAARKQFLQDGDIVEMSIEKLGVLQNPVRKT
ncbi:MAG: fumarylacetoacetate hydrolase family protein [Anaerolineaceae bacterium]|nr:fumarylacetoacetate hydrolase family protein [Anaerolineaceae bacterium]